jgi:hypothetical protein
MGGKMTLLRLKSRIIHWARQLTWSWLASLAMLLVCFAAYFVALVPMRQAIKEQRTHLDNVLRDEKHLQLTSMESARRAPSGQLDTFNQAFPFENSVTDSIEKLIDDAQKKGLNPKQAQYRLIKTNPGSLMGYQIILPIKGAYPKILEFVFEVLADIPNLALDNISFQRQKIGDSLIEANLMMTLYIRRGNSVEQ